MKRECIRCGNEYQSRQFCLSLGYCQECAPKFFSKPKPSTPAETKSLLKSLIVLNAVLFFFFSMLLDCGTISNPGMFFFSGTIIYLTTRLLIGHFSPGGHPTLSVLQRYFLILLPFYGFPIAFSAWMTIRKTFFNE